jgi:type II secretory pathway pseudopilin PulG
MPRGKAGRASARWACKGPTRGYALVLMLALVAVFAAASAAAVTRWVDDHRREQEQELLRVGDEIAGAIAAYRRASGGSTVKHPPTLEDLLEDRRAFGTVRYLRRLQGDPTLRGARWGLLYADDGGIRGVYSRSDARPWRQSAVRLRHVDLPVVSRYSDWHFVPREEVR